MSTPSFPPDQAPEGKSYAVLAGGCFWCTEAIYVEMMGVEKVESGYTGGQIKNPAYREVCTGRTGHAEGVRITFDPELVSYGQLLEVFWRTHDPTTLNRQGADVGTQYRSAIFPQDEEQERVARASMAAAEEAGLWDDPIVTTIEPAAAFYVAEDYHQDFYRTNAAHYQRYRAGCRRDARLEQLVHGLGKPIHDEQRLKRREVPAGVP